MPCFLIFDRKPWILSMARGLLEGKPPAFGSRVEAPKCQLELEAGKAGEWLYSHRFTRAYRSPIRGE